MVEKRDQICTTAPLHVQDRWKTMLQRMEMAIEEVEGLAGNW